jgi:SpoIIAA-like
MIEQIENLPPGIDGVRASGKISRDDYEKVVTPLLEAARRDGRRLRFLYEIGPEFDRFTPGAAWEDAKVGLRHLRLFEGVAVVTDLGWIRETTRLASVMMPCPVKVFGNSERAAAIEWLQSMSDRATVSQRLIPDSGVLVVEVTQALRSQDFDAIALTADTWIEAHGRLHGLVIHAKAFPGWENLGALMRHIRFVRDHQRKITRVAVSADSKLASIVPHIGEHFVKAEVRAFGYDDLEQAIAWAGSGSPTTER